VKVRRGSCLVLLLLLALGGCGALLGTKPIRQQRKFTIVAQPLRLALKGSERPYPFKVQIKRFEVSRLYERDQFISRLSAYEIQEDRWNTWASRPSDMLTTVVERYLYEAQLFTQLSQEFLDERPDYVLETVVKAIERFENNQQNFARLAMSMKLIEQKSGKIFWSGEFDEEEPVTSREIGAVVQALSDILHDKLEVYIRDLDFEFLNLMRQERGLRPLSAAELEDIAALGDTAQAGGEANAAADYEILYDPDKITIPAEE
jgi:ABC-type uncharacterized transport system auxiliary subunit